MGFISYSLHYYQNALQNLEKNIPTAQAVYHAKQLLKMLDDLVDEGYTELTFKIEEEFHGVTRLHDYLHQNHAEPFPMPEIEKHQPDYSGDQQELSETLSQLLQKAHETEKLSDHPFLQELICFCEWIGHAPDTAYIFLLRDTLLPYIRCLSQGRTNLYPWLLGRNTLKQLTGKENIDDKIRASIIEALEFKHCRTYHEFCDYVLPDIRRKLRNYPEIENFLIGLLNEIPQKNLIIIESGCYGTFPMLLMSLDYRADLRMYTTVPYLTDIYADRIYTKAYENNRLFETLYSQDVYFQLSALDDKCFYVNQCQNSEIQEKALTEVKTILT